MKRLIVWADVALTVIALAAILLSGSVVYQLSSTATVYPVTAFVSEIDPDTGTVTFEDSEGNLWTTDGGDVEWEEGELATLLL